MLPGGDVETYERTLQSMPMRRGLRSPTMLLLHEIVQYNDV